MDVTELLYPYIPWAGGLLAFFCLRASFRCFRRRSLSKGLPTSRALGVFMGLVELKGTAECERPVRSVLTDVDCVHYRWNVEEEWRTSTTDSDGKPDHDSGWTGVGGSSVSVPFYVKDATGAILVQPQGAEMDGAVVFNEICRKDDPLYYGKGPRSAIENSTGRRRFTERAIYLHNNVYIVGKARERKDVVAAEIAEDKHAPLFLISGNLEEEVQSNYMWNGVMFSLMGLVLLVGGLVWSDGLQHRSLAAHRPLYFAAGGGYLGVWLVAWVWNVFNDLIGLRNRVREGWSLVDIQLKRRHDLIPNLVRIVSALRDHEAAVHEQLPDRFVGLLALMRRFELLSAQDFERAAVKVGFAK